MKTHKPSGRDELAGNSIDACQLLELPRYPDWRGSLTVIEGTQHVPFEIVRAYWVYDVPGGSKRPGHAYRSLEEFIVALSGSLDVVVEDGLTTRIWSLNRSYFGLHVPSMLWRTLTNFSTNAVCLVLASQPFSEEDYIRDLEEFRRARTTQ